VDVFLLTMRIFLLSSGRSRVSVGHSFHLDGLYRLPSFLSKGARELIPVMLMNDPIKRITIPDIRKDPWFLFNCPPYLSIPWEEYASKHE
jgi:SNF1-related protein kinase catalytic subunit alpha KIN10